MTLDIHHKVHTLRRMTVKQLREKYVDVFGEETRSDNKDFLIKRIAWRMQANHEGGLSERAKRRAAELANEADLRLRLPKNLQNIHIQTTISGLSTKRDPRLPPPHTVLTRVYKGRTIEVMVLEQGFEFEGATYPSLSAVAKKVTGTHWNGFTFFQI